jgi:hypothetical protein
MGALAGMAAGTVVSLLAHQGAGSTHAVGQTIVSAAGGAMAGGLLGFSVAPQRWQRLTFRAPLASAAPPAP